MTLVVLGDVMVDVIARVSGELARGSDTPARVSVSGGGSAANVAAWAAALGTPVALVCRVGDDARGRAAVEELVGGGVQVHAEVDGERPTGTCVVLVEPGGERTMLPDPGANDAPLPEIPVGTHLHVVGYALLRDGPRASALAAIERARAAGMTVSVDPSSWALIRAGAIPEVDLLLPNEREAEVLGEREGMVVKLGAAGARWGVGSGARGAGRGRGHDRRGRRVRGRLSQRAAVRRRSPRASLEAGCAAAARAVARVGARP